MPGYTTTDIRNIALVGTAGAGKTTLVETMLHAAGVTGRIGRVEDGNTVSDHDDLAREFHHSLVSSIVHFDFDGSHLNIIDTPGRGDFIGQALSAYPAVETVVLVLDPNSGIDPVARRLMKSAQDRNLPRLIVVNKMDHAASLRAFLEAIQETFGRECLPINLPAGNGRAVIDCFGRADGESDLGPVADFHTAIVDQVVEVDEAMMERYLAGEKPSPEALHDPFERALRESHLVPICFASARDQVGIRELLHVFAHLCPNPLEGNPRPFVYPKDGAMVSFAAKPDSGLPLVAHVFKVASDPFVGRLCVFKVHQGHLGSDVSPRVDTARKPVRVAHVFKLRGKEHTEVPQIIAGDIGAVAKIEEIAYNATLHTGEISEDLHFVPIPLPRPMYGLALVGTSKGAETKLGDALRKMTAEDPTLVFERVQATGETVLRGLGELHLRAKLRLLKDQYGVEVQTHPPRVAYKETISAKAEGHHRHKKQTGGAGQFGEVFLRVEPVADGESTEDGLLFVDDTFGGSVPRQFLPAIEKGVRQVMAAGAIAGYPMHGIKVSVYDGKHHPVDSKEVAFVSAGRKAFVDAVRKARPVLLEPFVRMEITVPADMIGDISSDMSGRRGRIQGTDMLPGNQALITAEAPLAETMTYANTLKSMTGGAGSYSMEYSHDEPTPSSVQADVIAKYSPQHDEDD
ncbi:MAG: elongation factor G [Phycisphaeraceae bacterium]|nr:elongation factor G [Phycisphaeraceae bacterium]